MPPAPPPDFIRERALHHAGRTRICGIDEVGRGPLAGPVVAAAVILDPAAIPDGIRDSKRLTRLRRRALAARIAECAEVGIGSASVEEIDEINILQATLLAMRRAVAALPAPPDHALIDGNRHPGGLPCPADTLVRGDALSLSIAAASIAAKVWRDDLMAELAVKFPGYGWERNAGYGTLAHHGGLQLLGVTPHHRRSFRPVHNILYQGNSSRP
ncbi:ribonuclease HII [Profundibacterium mesophilum]|uniref:Ribonuclease HII n=1 Tax=Profundibacterium mesophilum KAUST100406-0324 TaxID=1037889 RepID=A0A921NTZ5_9RHOB|nr:ribonuclease HII [Profundibacterium mesophilum]KAF0675490.1 Ribonuclease HII [Profundibacterium mesophilum KAUST100406-0324]